MELSSLIFFLYFRKELPSLKNKKKPALQKFVIFSQKKHFLYFGKRNFLIFSLKKFFLFIFPKMVLFSLKNKKLLEETFQAQEIKKPTLKEFLVFQEIELSSLKPKNILYFRRNFQSLKIKNLLYSFQHFLFLERELFKKFLILSLYRREIF